MAIRSAGPSDGDLIMLDDPSDGTFFQRFIVATTDRDSSPGEHEITAVSKPHETDWLQHPQKRYQISFFGLSQLKLQNQIEEFDRIFESQQTPIVQVNPSRPRETAILSATVTPSWYATRMNMFSDYTKGNR